MSNNDVQALTIEELFFGNAIYTIPSYQRNYAWGQAQVEQLINDIRNIEHVLSVRLCV